MRSVLPRGKRNVFKVLISNYSDVVLVKMVLKENIKGYFKCQIGRVIVLIFFKRMMSFDGRIC